MEEEEQKRLQLEAELCRRRDDLFNYTFGKKTSLDNFLGLQIEDVNQLRIGVFGPTGSGKSRFINSCERTVRQTDKGTCPVHSDGNQGTIGLQDYLPEMFFHLVDTMGFFNYSAQEMANFENMLTGKLQPGDNIVCNPFLYASAVQEMNQKPEFSQRMHGIIIVVKANDPRLPEGTMRNYLNPVRVILQKTGIAPITVVTHSETLDIEEERKDALDDASAATGSSISNTFFLSNYTEDNQERNPEIEKIVFDILDCALMNAERVVKMMKLKEKNEKEEEYFRRQLGEIQERLKAKGEQEEDIQRRIGEMEQQLREKEDQNKNLTSQLRWTEQQLREREVQKESLTSQLRELEQQLTNLPGQLWEQVTTLERQLRVKEQHVNELEVTLSAAQHALSEYERQQVTPDWVISRDQIHLTAKLLGVGGWGRVFEGKYCGCFVAVKQIHELILSPHNRSLFEREINIAARIRHPCLLQFIGATNDEGSPLFVTELMESNLRALLGQRTLSSTEVSIISLDVARALNYLHQKNPSPIIHRDISSANVLLWRQGDQWRGKVSDYGTAKIKQHTMTVAPGAVIYSAPEALTPHQTVKFRCSSL